jgi:hypothetical protein
MVTITDEYMRESLAKSKEYCVVILRHGPNWGMPGMEAIIWEHGRRNFALRAEGTLPIVCAIRDESDTSGVGVFTTHIEETRKIMDEDPGVKAGLFVYEVHPCRSFPGDALPK